MAIFYKHIKGCGANTTGNTAPLEGTSTIKTTSEAWCWISWPSQINYTKNPTADFHYVENTPTIGLNNANITPSIDGISLGHIIVSQARGQELKYYLTLKDGLEVQFKSSPTTSERYFKVIEDTGDSTGGQTLSTNSHMWFHSSGLMFNSPLASDTFLPDTSKSFGQIYFESYEGSTQVNRMKILSHLGTSSDKAGKGVIQLVGTKTEISHQASVGVSLYVGEDYQDPGANNLKVKNKCEALYFNAASDRRAKSNITPTQFSALNIVNSLPTYTFNYNNKEEKTLGLIAQEAAEFNLDGFNMVDNLEATGQDGDFMQMKESKLVYVLWKAVQELSAEVEELKAEIHNLK